MKRWLPSPPLSIALFAFWLLLDQPFDAAALLMGAALALVVPLLTRGLRPTPARMRRPLLVLRLTGVVAIDVARSALDVSRLLLTRRTAAIASRFVQVPLELRDANALAVLAMATLPDARHRLGRTLAGPPHAARARIRPAGRSGLHHAGEDPLRATLDGDLRDMTPMLLWALKGALFLLALAMLCALGRLLLGPTAQDRVLALDCLYVNGMLTMLVLGILYASSVYYEAAMLIALFGFVGSTALAKFLLRGEVIE